MDYKSEQRARKVMIPIKCFTSSSIGPAPDLYKNFLEREKQVSITWDDGFNFNDTSWFKVFHQCEPPEVLNIVDKLIEHHNFYDLILAWDERVLKQCPNSTFLTESACSWLDRKSGRISPAPLGQMRVEGYDKPQSNPVVANYMPCDVMAKRFAVSYLTSQKSWCPGHRLRQEIYAGLPEEVGQIVTFKHRSPPMWPDKRDILEPFQYSIIPENSRHNGYYTEKVVDCFVAMTIPVYWGCPDLYKYFNPEGFLTFSDFPDLMRVLEKLTPEYYMDHMQAVEENYTTALKSVYQWDILEWAITKGIYQKLRGLPCTGR